jgi:hypothetical protein
MEKNYKQCKSERKKEGEMKKVKRRKDIEVNRMGGMRTRLKWWSCDPFELNIIL